MPHARFVLGLGFACLFAITLGCSIPWGPFAASLRGQILVPVGTVLRVPGFTGVIFNVPSEGAVLEGAAEADHTMSMGAHTAGGPPGYCPGVYPPYFGSPMSYTANQNLTAGTYIWGVGSCGSLGNITITQSIEVLYKGQN